jgi:DNA modification methylase
MNNLDTFKAIDAVKGMSEIDKNSIDLVVTSPPYDNLRNYEGYVLDIPNTVKELYRIMKPGGVVVWVVADSVENGGETGNSFRHAIRFIDSGFKLNDTMIYMKTGTTFPENGPRYNQVFDFMFVFSKGAPKTFNRICDIPKLWEGSWGRSRVRQKDGSLKDVKNLNTGKGNIRDETGKFGWKQRPNVWLYASGGKFKHPDFEIARQHPATFPYKLAEDHILSWSNIGDVVLDPFCGSGTVGLAANKNGRNYIMFDISEKYIEIVRERLNEGKK